MHDNALTKESAALFPQLSRFEDFYLAGGTALSLQIGHRLSVDFDLFSRKELARDLLAKIKRIFPRSSFSVTYRAPEQLNILIDNVKTTFLHYPYPIIESLVAYKNVPIANIHEIAAMKAFSIGKRLSYKDYIDWYFLLKEKRVDLMRAIERARKKFGGDFNDRLFLGQLVSLKDIPTQKIDFLRDEVRRKTLEHFLKETVRKFKL